MLPLTVRTLVRQPLFAAAAVLTLSLGIAAPTALFSTVNAVLLEPLPFPQPDQLYTVRTYFPSGRFTIGMMASEEMAVFDRLTDLVSGTALVRRNNAALVTDAGPREVVAYGVSSHFFELFGVPMAAGRAIEEADGVRGAPRVVVLSHALWASAFGGRADVIGAPITIGDSTGRIIGVAPERFDLPAGTEMWGNMWIPESIGHGFDGYLRLKPGVTPATLQPRLAQAMSVLGRKYPDQEDGRAFAMKPLLEATVGDLGPILLILFGATALLLALAAANVSNLILARAMGRTREMAVRAALGARRGRIVRILLGESMLLAAAGGGLGVVGAFAFLKVLMGLGGSRLPRLDAVTFDLRVAAFAAALIILTGLLVGLAPALRITGNDLAPVLNDTSRSVRGSRRTRRVLGAFVIAEIAIAVALVAGAARLVQSYRHLSAMDPGFQPEGRLALDVLLPVSYMNQPRWNAWWDATEEKLREAGASSAAMASSLPLQHEWDSTAFVDLVSRPDIPADQRPNGRMRVVSGDFFKTLGIPILAGRPFDRTDTPQSQVVVIVNEAFVRRSLPDVDPLRERVKGFRFRNENGKIVDVEVPIVGVAGNVKYAGLTDAAEPTVYLAASQAQAPRASIVVTTPDGHPERRVALFRSAIAAVDPKIPVEVHQLEDVVSTSIERPRLGMWLMSGFGATALLLALVGIFGVVGYVVSQREDEMAIRQTLGATRARVFVMVLSQTGWLAAAGIAFGTVLAWWTGHLIGKYVFDVRPADPAILVGSAAVVAIVAALATLGPAVRAATPGFARSLHQK